jgi:predicted DNA-binding protein YlxM (UPF0122 family)
MTTINVNRKQDMINMRDSAMTLQEIADKYGISRERVRQIIGNTGHDAMQERVKQKISTVQSNPQMTNSEIKELLNKKYGAGLGYKLSAAWNGMRHAISGGELKKGTKIEALVSEHLQSIGIGNKLMPHMHSFDMLLDDGKKIDVKACFSSRKTNEKQKCDMYQFGVGKNRRGNYCDFFICYIVPTGDYFIIPNEEVSMVDSVYISWPTPKRSWTKWHSYHNRFDLLKSQ